MATLADVLKGYVPPTESGLVDPLKAHIKALPQKFAENQAAQMALLSQAFPGNAYESMMTQGDPKAFAELGMQVPFNAMVAYHGTPHDILGKFDISKVGTGSGAQAQGHGMYFAESPEIAKGFGKNLYKVDIPDEYVPKMLDWYAPLLEQSELVQNAIKKAGIQDMSLTGEKVYSLLAKPEKVGKFTKVTLNAKPEISEKLKELGIPGIKYENFQIKKGQGANTTNYVVFDPSEVQMLEKNGKAISRKDLIEEQIKALKD
jgi:hypothetical protein